MHYQQGLLTKYRQRIGQLYLKQLIPWMMEQPFLGRADLLACISWMQAHPEMLFTSYVQYNATAYQQRGEVVYLHRLLQELYVLWARVTGRALHLQAPLPGGFITGINHHVGDAWDRVTVTAATISFYLGKEAPRVCTLENRSTIAPGVAFLQEDHNPYNTSNAHPDVAFVSYDLGGKSTSAWVEQFRDAFALLKRSVPEMYTLLLPFVDTIVPMGYEPGRQYSSAYKESPCVLYLSYTDTVRKQAEALVHEIHHTVYNAIDTCTPILTNGREELYLSGYRPDPRPIQGCFLGVHAFAGVQLFYTEHYKQADSTEQQDLQPIIATIHEQNRVTLDTVRHHGQLTEHGKAIFADCEELIKRTQEVYENIPKDIRTRAREAMDIHVANVKKVLPSVHT